MNIREWWDLQDAGRKRNLYILGGILGVVAIAMVLPDRPKSPPPDTVSEIDTTILGDDQGAGDIQQLTAENRVMKRQMDQMQGQFQKLGGRIRDLQNALSAATSLSENPEQVGQLVDELNRLREDVQDIREGRRPQGANSQTESKVLVLGEEDDSGDARALNADQDSGSVGIADPFRGVDADDAGPIAAYDPLASIKSAISGASERTPRDQSRSFDFLQDGDFDRPPPQIVIDEPKTPEPRSRRSGGSRPGQTARDHRGEMVSQNEALDVYIPSGSLFEGVLLNGMDAPTSSGSAQEPYPATIRLTSLAFLPNRFTANVRECFVGAAGFGRLDSERVHLRTETLSCVTNDGQVIDVALKGYITGEDGKVGLRGIVVERTGQLLMRAALSGLGSGLSQALEPQRITSVRTGDRAGGVEFDAPDPTEVLEIGAYSGAASALEKMADYYLERADQIFPIIEIDAMREVTVHLTTGVRLTPVDMTALTAVAQRGR